MITDVFFYVVTIIHFPFHHECDLPNYRQFTGFVITRETRRVPHVEQDLLTLPEQLRSPTVFGGTRVAFIVVLSYLYLCTIICLFVFYF